jgi:HSP20 family protein
MGAPLTTALSRRDPVYSMTPFSSFFEDFFNDFMTRPTLPSGYLPGSYVPDIAPVMRARMDVVDKGETFLVTIDLPGVKKDDISINIEGARVAVTANVLTETPVKEGERLLYTERMAKSYARSFELPVEVTEVGAQAVYDNGVLMLTLPKRAPSTARRLAVQ